MKLWDNSSLSQIEVRDSRLRKISSAEHMNLILTMYMMEWRLALLLLPVPPEAAGAAAAEEQLVAAGGRREGALADEAAAPAARAAIDRFVVIVVVDGDDVGLGVDVRVGGDGGQEVGDGREDVLEGDLEEETTS